MCLRSFSARRFYMRHHGGVAERDPGVGAETRRLDPVGALPVSGAVAASR